MNHFENKNGFNGQFNAIVAEMAFQVAEEGLYWFDVAVEEDVLTSMPLRIIYRQIHTAAGGTPWE